MPNVRVLLWKQLLSFHWQTLNDVAQKSMWARVRRVGVAHSTPFQAWHWTSGVMACTIRSQSLPFLMMDRSTYIIERLRMEIQSHCWTGMWAGRHIFSCWESCLENVGPWGTSLSRLRVDHPHLHVRQMSWTTEPASWLCAKIHFF